MNHVNTKTGNRWWWWVALVCTIEVVVSVPVSFKWKVEWKQSTSTGVNVLYVGCGMLHFEHYDPNPGSIPNKTSMLGNFRIAMSRPWVALPLFKSHRSSSTWRMWLFVFPLHVFLIILLPIVLYPYLLFVKKRHRRKHGLCMKCAYDLTDNESGTCPECGTEIKA